MPPTPSSRPSPFDPGRPCPRLRRDFCASSYISSRFSLVPFFFLLAHPTLTLSTGSRIFMVVARFPPSHRHACIHTFHMSSFRKLGDFFLSFSLSLCLDIRVQYINWIHKCTLIYQCLIIIIKKENFILKMTVLWSCTIFQYSQRLSRMRIKFTLQDFKL